MNDAPDGLPTLQGYEVAGLVGVAPAGTFYAARNRLTAEPVVLERIAPALTGAPGFREELIRVARRLRSVASPRMVATLDVVEEDGLALILEPVGGCPLDTLLSGPALTPPLVLGIAADVLTALEAAHDAGLVHGGVSAEHIVAGLDGHARLGGFAVCAALAAMRAAATRPAAGGPDATGMAASPPSPIGDLHAAAGLIRGLIRATEPAGSRDLAAEAIAPPLAQVLDPQPGVRQPTAATLRSDLLRAAESALGTGWRRPGDLVERVAAIVESRRINGSGAAPAIPAPVSPQLAATPPGAAGHRSVSSSNPVQRVPPPVLPTPYPPPPGGQMRPPARRPRRRQSSPLTIILAVIAILGIGAVIAFFLIGNPFAGASSGNTGPLSVKDPIRVDASPQSAGCDADFHFAASAGVTGVGDLTYRWEPSFGQPSQNLVIHVTKDDSSFRAETTLRIQGKQPGQKTVVFHVFSPTERSIPATVTYTCS